MLKKITVVTALSTALFFGGTIHNSVDASASADQSQNQPYKIYYTINGNWSNVSSDKINHFLKYCNWNEEQKQEQSKEETEEVKSVEKTEEPKQEEATEEKQEQPKQDKQGQKQEQPKQEEQKQPEEQAEAPVQQPEQKQEESNQSQSQSQQLNAFEQEVVELTNNERAKQGLEPLKVDEELSKVAREKSRDMSANNYFAHNSPTYGSPFDMMKSYGVSYRTAGENIAKGQRTPAEVVDGWMNSDGHRANILKADFTHIGVGYVEQGNHWTQQFIGK